MHRVFVYGTLKRSQGNWHHFLADQVFVGPAITIPKYVMVAGSFPMIFDAKDGDEGASDVVGECYDVDDAALQRLDGLEGYRGKDQMSNMYDRKLIDILTYTAGKFLKTKAFIYVGGQRLAGDSRGWLKFWNIRNTSGQLEWPRATT